MGGKGGVCERECEAAISQAVWTHYGAAQHPSSEQMDLVGCTGADSTTWGLVIDKDQRSMIKNRKYVFADDCVLAG